MGHRLMTIILSSLNRFKNVFTGKFLGEFVVKGILKLPLHLAYVATLPCETLMSAKQGINDKLQGSVATYLRYDGLLITKFLFCSSAVVDPRVGHTMDVLSPFISVLCHSD